MDCKGLMTREGTCQSLQSRALSLDVDSKQRLLLYPTSIRQYNVLRGENRGPFKAQQASASRNAAEEC